MKNLAALTLSVILLSGCSSIVSKSAYPVVISSQPDGASFVVTNRAGEKVESGDTPATITLKASSGFFKNESYTVVLNKEGYSAKTYTFSSTLDGWYFGNIMLGGIIGMVFVDPATGAMYKLPDRVETSLEQTASTDRSNSITIATIDVLSESKIALLQPIE